MNPQRILRQKLEDLRRAGVTHVPSELASLVEAISHPVESAAASVPTAGEPLTSGLLSSGKLATGPNPAVSEAPEATQPGDAGSRSAAASAVSPAAKTQSSPSAPASPRQFLASSSGAMPEEFSPDRAATRRPCSTLSRDERTARLSDVAAQVAACTRCQELAETRTQTVFGVGNPEARIMYIGEAPGADEDRLGEPFVGRAGQLLDKITEACQLTRDEIYICNILRCRPPGNRNPKPDESANCREYLDAQIELVDPEYIVCWGSVAAHNLLDTKAAIGKMRGRFFEYKGIKVLCTYHPSYLLRSPGAKKDVWADMKFFRADMGVHLG